mmetsp:Transcript_100495/g.174446  ORF Transcript_100495/g.174446 Transcript_100495/m.174446 type:complete len:209 (-) Transcript_100495:2307-2933(-)
MSNTGKLPQLRTNRLTLQELLLQIHQQCTALDEATHKIDLRDSQSGPVRYLPSSRVPCGLELKLLTQHEKVRTCGQVEEPQRDRASKSAAKVFRADRYIAEVVALHEGKPLLRDLSLNAFNPCAHAAVSPLHVTSWVCDDEAGMVLSVDPCVRLLAVAHEDSPRVWPVTAQARRELCHRSGLGKKDALLAQSSLLLLQHAGRPWHVAL